MKNMDSPWDEDAQQPTHQDAEWLKMSSEFTNVGYREGITAGKESSLQEGFDAGFANVGAPLGRELGRLRGIASAVIALLNSSDADVNDRVAMLESSRDISSRLSQIKFSDIAPRDLEAEEHAQQHLEAQGEEVDVHEDIAAKRKMEGIEDILANLTSENANGSGTASRPSMEDIRILEVRLGELAGRLGIENIQ